MFLKAFFPLRSGFHIKKRIISGFFLGVILAYLLYMLFLFFRQDAIVFQKHNQRLNAQETQISSLEESEITTSDGEKLKLWIAPPQPNKPVLLYFPGNRGIIQVPKFLKRFATLTENGCGLVAVSYRGYGGSTGTPSEEGIKRDGEAAYELAMKRFGNDHKIIGYGESLGTGVAVYVATQKYLDALILQAPYTSLQDIAKAHYPFPAAFLLRYSFPSEQIIGRIHAPILILHGAKDPLIPLKQAETLFSLAPTPKRLVVFSKGSHALLESSPEILKFLNDFNEDFLPPEESRWVDAS